jgi:hypothetical protein
MDERQIVDSIGKLAGVVTALEMQVQAVLLAAVKAGMEPDDVLQAFEAMPEPNVPSLGKDAYDQAMAGFWRCLDEAVSQREGTVPEAPKPMLTRFMRALRRNRQLRPPGAR